MVGVSSGGEKPRARRHRTSGAFFTRFSWSGALWILSLASGHGRSDGWENSLLEGVHIGFTHFLHQGCGEPNGQPQLPAVELGHEDLGRESIIQALGASSPAKVEAVDKVTKALGP